MNGDYMSLAEAAGEVEPQSRGWTAEELHDVEEELRPIIMERERHDAAMAQIREMDRLRSENVELRRQLAEATGVSYAALSNPSPSRVIQRDWWEDLLDDDTDNGL